jgi:ferrous iron transport protein A
MSVNRNNLTALNRMDPESRGKVVRIAGSDMARRRIMEMGLVPGAEIEVIRRAPLGDPIELRVKGYNLTLRRFEAELISVEEICQEKGP